MTIPQEHRDRLVTEQREELAWHLYCVMEILQTAAEDLPEVLDGFPGFSTSLLHQNAYQISTAITQGIVPNAPIHVVERIVEAYMESLEHAHGEEAEEAQEQTE